MGSEFYSQYMVVKFGKKSGAVTFAVSSRFYVCPPQSSAHLDLPYMPRLPHEIEELILNFLAEEDKRRSALKACSLVCQAFLPMCRKSMFGSIIINSHYL